MLLRFVADAALDLIAVRIIGQLKPVYRESWLTDGLNLKDRSLAV